MKSETIPAIADIIDFYHKNSVKMGISDLLRLRDNLAARSYHLAEECAKIKLSYNEAYFIRKIGVARAKNALMNQHSGIKAESLAMVEGESLFNDEIQAEAAAYRIDLLLKQVNAVLRAMEQRIAHLRTEYERTAKQ